MVVLAMTFAVSMASAQALNSGAQTIALNATLAESLTLSLSANAVNFTLAAGSATNAGTAALTDGTNNIPSSAFFISDNGGASTALTSTVVFGAANAGYQMANVAITGANKTASRTDVMAFNINLTGGTLPQLPASIYTGTLNIQAQATP